MFAGNFWRFDFPSILDFLEFETSPVNLPWFRISKNFSKLTKNAYQKIPSKNNQSSKPLSKNILELSKIPKILVLTCYFRYIIPRHTKHKHTQNRPRTLRSQDNQLFVFWSFLVQFRRNLGLKHTKTRLNTLVFLVSIYGNFFMQSGVNLMKISFHKNTINSFSLNKYNNSTLLNL